jgi:ribonucleoside-diphosphate reductase alpha chain
MMDCDTMGIEPELALVKYKKLVGGGNIKIVNSTVPEALFKLGYTADEVNAIVSYVDATGTIEGAPGIRPEHLSVFDCSFKPIKGTRTIPYMGHIKMMAAAQPFLSGAISKTVNLPHEATIEDLAEAYAESWRQGLKAVAIYRDGSKGTQPLNTSMDDRHGLDAAGTRVLSQLAASQPAAEADLKALEGKSGETVEVPAQTVFLAGTAFQRVLDEIAKLAAVPTLQPSGAQEAINPDVQDQNAPPRAIRHRLPGERASITHKFALNGHEGYITVGLYPSGQPGEIFIRMAKEGSTVSGMMDSFATSISIALQHGVPLKVLCNKFAYTRFEPFGWTGNPQIGQATSIMDYIFRWMDLRFLSGTQLSLFSGMVPQAPQLTPSPSMAPETEPYQDSLAQSHLARLAEEVAKRLNQVSGPPSGGGIAPDAQADAVSASRIADAIKSNNFGTLSGLTAEAMAASGVSAPRGVYHATEAMREMYEMGDAPSCPVCGAIMVRNGSCHRCLSCGTTSGCS